jgi:DNA-binding CsgD family transcriptional regulator/tetratricopeptide (TPR) repeat protein
VATVSSPTLVGRTAELARARQAIDDAATGRPQLVTITGEAGIGKSRLVRELVAGARADGSRILAGGCLDIGDASVPYLPLAEALRGLARGVDPRELETLLGPTRADLATVAPELAGATSDDLEPAEGSVGQARLFERVLQLVGRLGEPRPLVVVVEDVQWIDRATRDLITFLVRNVTTERVAAFLTVRTDDLPAGHENLAWLAELGRAPGGVRIPLEPLGRGEVAELIGGIIGGSPDPDLVDRVWRRSEGNPFFAEELLAAGEGRPGSRSTAVDLVEILLGRLRALSPETRAVVDAVALANRPVDERLLEQVLDRRRDALRPAFREAVERHVLREEPNGEVVVRHELLREVVEQGLLAGERRDLHERFAVALTAHPELADPSPAGAAGELARHWAAAGRVAEAWAAAVVAARAAEAMHAHADAFREFERARSLEDELPADARPSTAERLDLRRRATEAADLAGAFERSIELAREGLELARELDDRVAMGLLHSRLGYLRWAIGDADGGLEDHREAVRLIPADPPSAARARVLGGLAGSLMGPRGYEESAELAQAAIDCAQAVGAVAEEARARNVLGFDLVALGRLEVGLDELRRSRDLAREGGPPDMLVVAHYNLALNLAEAGLLDEAVEEAQAGREAARRVGLERRFGFDLAALAGDVLLRLGRWDEADAVTLDALRLDRAERGSAFLSAVRGRLEGLRGQATSAMHRFAVADELGAGDDPDTAAYVACGRAEVELAAERPDAAMAIVEATLAPGAPAHALFVRAPLLALGLRAAADGADRSRAARDEAGVREWQDRMAGLVAHVERVAAATRADATATLVALARAEAQRATNGGRTPDWLALAEHLETIGDGYLAAYARWRGAEAELRARGTRSDAERLLRDAWRTALRLGAEPLRREIEALARRARVPLEAAAPTGPAVGIAEAPAAVAPPEGTTGGAVALRRAGLSDREIEVLRLVAAGRTNGQIAERLFITRKTAGVHVTHILDKLAVANRVEAAMVAARLGLEPDEDDGRP